MQIKDLLDLSEKFDVELKINKNNGEIVLYGSENEIIGSSECVYDIFRKAARQLYDRSKAKLVLSYVQWYRKPSGNLVEYPDHLNCIIETAYRDREKEVKFSDAEGITYTLNLHEMVEYQSDNKSAKTSVTRIDKRQNDSNQSKFHMFICFSTLIKIRGVE